VGILARVRIALSGVGIGLVFLVAYCAGRQDRTKSPVSFVTDQVTPTNFDLLKELNAHVGRLATVLAIVVAATSFTLANGPIRDALSSFNVATHGHVYGMLLLLGATLWIGTQSVMGAMTPALPLVRDDEKHWTDLVARRTTQSMQAAVSVSFSASCLLLAWIFSYLPLLASGELAIAVLSAVGMGLYLQLERSIVKRTPWWRFW
jgi:hypothetical protein